MSKQSNAYPLPMIIILLLAAALLGAMYLARSNQNTQKGAYFSGAKLLMLPDTVTAAVGDEVPVQLWVQTEMITGTTAPAKVSSVDTTFCYGSGLSLGTTNPSAVIDLNQEAFTSLEYVKDQDNCLRIVAVSGGIAPENLKSGLLRVASIRFKAVTAGSGNLTLDVTKSIVAGYNPAAGATDTSMKMDTVANASYTISAMAFGLSIPKTSFWEMLMAVLRRISALVTH